MSAAIAKQNEPTMDEILASIRKIISDDLGETSPVSPASRVSLKPEPSGDVFELSADMALPATKEPPWNVPLGRVEEPVSEPKPVISAPKSVDPVSAVTELAARMALLSARSDLDTGEGAAVSSTSPATEQAVTSAFGSLRESIAREHSADAALSSAMTLVVEAALRPMLKEWIDANLPAMVERLVKAEIERMAKRG
jgi:uncharacterized protein